MLYFLLAIIAIGVLLVSRGGKKVLSWLVIGGVGLVILGIIIGVFYYLGEQYQQGQKRQYTHYITVNMQKTSLTYTGNMMGDYTVQLCLQNRGAKQVKGVAVTINYYNANHQALSSEEVLVSYDMNGQILIPGGEVSVSKYTYLHPPNQKYFYDFTISEVEF